MTHITLGRIGSVYSALALCRFSLVKFLSQQLVNSIVTAILLHMVLDQPPSNGSIIITDIGDIITLKYPP